jgi:hypothetical protein
MTEHLRWRVRVLKELRETVDASRREELDQLISYLEWCIDGGENSVTSESFTRFDRESYRIFAAGSREILDVKFHDKAGSLTLTMGRKKSVIKLRQLLHGVYSTSLDIISSSVKGDERYILISITLTSRGNPEVLRCGAGTETTLFWLKLNSRLEAEKILSDHVDSCMESFYSGYVFYGSFLRVECRGLNESPSKILTYDRNQPEKGYRIETRY